MALARRHPRRRQEKVRSSAVRDLIMFIRHVFRYWEYRIREALAA